MKFLAAAGMRAAKRSAQKKVYSKPEDALDHRKSNKPIRGRRRFNNRVLTPDAFSRHQPGKRSPNSGRDPIEFAFNPLGKISVQDAAHELFYDFGSMFAARRRRPCAPFHQA